MEKYDLIIVGAGPAGIFTAVELLRHGSKKKKEKMKLNRELVFGVKICNEIGRAHV